jgi:hypothetical protein
MAAPMPVDTRDPAGRRLRAMASPTNVAAVASFTIAAVVYVRTLLPGVGFGDWAESELLLSRLGILHPTGYPLYSIVGWFFSLIPFESVAWRANLVSAMAAAGVVGMAVLIMGRLGVRPLLAAVAAVSLAFTGTLWEEATFSEMNSLHLLLVALLLHRALVWQAERRDRDLVLGALLGGLCVSNHGLAITVVPIVVVFALVEARREIVSRPLVLVKAAGAFALGLLPYVYLPLRAIAGPRDVYAEFLDWDGFFAHVSGAQFRGDMHFTSLDSARAALGAMPHVLDQLIALSNVAFVAIGLIGIVVLSYRNHWFALLLLALGLVNVYIYANYLGDLAHYLLTTWLILAIGLAVAADALIHALVERVGPPVAIVRFAALALPLVIFASQWSAHDQSANHDGERFTAAVFAALPANAVLVTYWDALTPLSYEHCNEGVRPDVSLRAYDSHAFVTCDPEDETVAELATHRPVYALMVQEESIGPFTHLGQIPVETITVPWGQRYPQLDRTLFRLVPPGQAP